MVNDKLADAIDDILPQTQCGLCGYGACRPYAEAISQHNEMINLCPPGGTETVLSLAKLLQVDPSPFLDEMTLNAKPPTRAIIREAECIGCTKCIQACPVDAILGSAKKMHTVLASECTGCELCVEPCPVDCIEMVMVEPLPPSLQKIKSNLARKRYQARNKRLTSLTHEQSLSEKTLSKTETTNLRQAAIKEAILRAKEKKRRDDGC